MNNCNVKCKWLEIQRIVINPDGQVLPCCYFANLMHVGKKFGYPTTRPERPLEPKLEHELVNYDMFASSAVTTKILKDYIEVADELNVFNHPIDKILEHPWFNLLYESWDDSDKVSRICLKHCSTNTYIV